MSREKLKYFMFTKYFIYNKKKELKDINKKELPLTQYH